MLMLKFFRSEALRYSGVWVVGLSERVEEKLNLFLVVFLVDVAEHPVVAAFDQLRSGLDRVFGQFFLRSSFSIRSFQSSSASASSFGQGAFWRLSRTVSFVLKSIGCLISSLIF